MLIYAVDDEPNALSILSRAIEEATPDAELRCFSSPFELLDAAKVRMCDVAFLDVQMPGMNGVTLAEHLKELHPKVNIIFATGYGEYKGTAMDLRASGYIMKPADAEDVREELQNLRHQTREAPAQPAVLPPAAKRVSFRCFGSFEAFIDGRPVSFARNKTKELLAFLVDARALCNNKEIMAALWEDDKSGAYLRILRKDLLDTFRAAGCEDVFLQRWDQLGIDEDKVRCDYYDYLRGDPEAIRSYWGEYMRQYTWSEFTNGRLEERMRK